MECSQRHNLFNEFKKLKEQIEAFLSYAVWNITDLEDAAELVDFADCFENFCYEWITDRAEGARQRAHENPTKRPKRESYKPL